MRRGLAALQRVEELAGALGPYALQAEIAACHARARTAAETDWQRIAALYDALAQLTPSPVIELNRAVAVAMAFGPIAGLELIDTVASEPSLKAYHLLPSVRGDFLFKLGRFHEAQTEFERAASLTRNARERNLLLEPARRCAPSHGDESSAARALHAVHGSRLSSSHGVTGSNPPGRREPFVGSALALLPVVASLRARDRKHDTDADSQ